MSERDRYLGYFESVMKKYDEVIIMGDLNFPCDRPIDHAGSRNCTEFLNISSCS
jgi:hypothetical protein